MSVSPRWSFFFNDTATTEIYTLSLHDALPISMLADIDMAVMPSRPPPMSRDQSPLRGSTLVTSAPWRRSEEHTSELQSRPHLVCRLLLEKKKKRAKYSTISSASTRCPLLTATR